MNGIDDENHSRLFFRQSGSEEASRLHGNDSHATTRTNCLHFPGFISPSKSILAELIHSKTTRQSNLCQGAAESE